MKSLQVSVEVGTDRGLLAHPPAGLDDVDDGGLLEDAVVYGQLEHVAHTPPGDAVAGKIFLQGRKIQLAIIQY